MFLFIFLKFSNMREIRGNMSSAVPLQDDDLLIVFLFLRQSFLEWQICNVAFLVLSGWIFFSRVPFDRFFIRARRNRKEIGGSEWATFASRARC